MRLTKNEPGFSHQNNGGPIHFLNPKNDAFRINPAIGKKQTVAYQKLSLELLFGKG